MKWLVVLLGIVVFGVVGLTALDKYDERSCRENPAVVGTRHVPAEEPFASGGVQVMGVPAHDEPIFETCDGFLPW